MKIDKALQRLTHVLPLKDSQEKCRPGVKKLHQEILRSFVTKGRILTREEMMEYTEDVDSALAVLKDYDMIVYSGDDLIGAYPMTMEKREHSVHVNSHTVYAMCALDALAVSQMFAMDAEIVSQCRVTHDLIRIKQLEQTITNFEEVADVHFGIIWAAASEGESCATSLCMDMIFLRDKEIAQQWLADDSVNRETFNLKDAVEFSGRFFVPLMS